MVREKQETMSDRVDDDTLVGKEEDCQVRFTFLRNIFS